MLPSKGITVFYNFMQDANGEHHRSMAVLEPRQRPAVVVDVGLNNELDLEVFFHPTDTVHPSTSGGTQTAPLTMVAAAPCRFQARVPMHSPTVDNPMPHTWSVRA